MSKREFTPYWQGVMKRREKARRLKDKKNRMEAWFRMTPRERRRAKAYRKAMKSMMDSFNEKLLFQQYPTLPNKDGKLVQFRKFEPFERGIGE